MKTGNSSTWLKAMILGTIAMSAQVNAEGIIDTITGIEGSDQIIDLPGVTVVIQKHRRGSAGKCNYSTTIEHDVNDLKQARIKIPDFTDIGLHHIQVIDPVVSAPLVISFAAGQDSGEVGVKLEGQTLVFFDSSKPCGTLVMIDFLSQLDLDLRVIFNPRKGDDLLIDSYSLDHNEIINRLASNQGIIPIKMIKLDKIVEY